MLTQHDIERIADAVVAKIPMCHCPLSEEEFGIVKSMIRLYKTAEKSVFKIVLVVVLGVSSIITWFAVRE